jgi:hypothetical protein
MPVPEHVHRIIAARNIVAGFHRPNIGQNQMSILPMIPKKNVPPALHERRGTEGWGLHAKQGFSLFKIALWIVLMQALGFTFVIFWLLFITKTDLQNAFVPVTYLTSLIALIVGISQFISPA